MKPEQQTTGEAVGPRRNQEGVRFPKTDKHDSTPYQNLWDTAKVDSRGKAYIKKKSGTNKSCVKCISRIYRNSKQNLELEVISEDKNEATNAEHPRSILCSF